MDHRARLVARGRVNDLAGLEARGGTAAATGDGAVGGANGRAQQAHKLEIQRCDDQADVGRKAHPRGKAKGSELVKFFAAIACQGRENSLNFRDMFGEN